MVDITVLGNTGTYPMPNRHLQSIHVQYEGYTILVDCGEGSLVALMEQGVQPQSIDAILFTHMHGDHTFGIMGLVQTMSLLERTKPLNIYGDGVTLKIVCSLLRYTSCKFKINCIEIKEQNIESIIKFKELNVQAIKLSHNTPVFGYVFDVRRLAKFDREKAIQNDIPIKYWNDLQHGKQVTDESGRILTPQMVLGDSRKGIKFVYATDTRPCKSLISDKVMNPDLLIIEQMYFDKSDQDKALKNKHMMLDEAIQIQTKIRAKKTMLVHLATSVFPGQVSQELSKRRIDNISVASCGEKMSIDFS